MAITAKTLLEVLKAGSKNKHSSSTTSEASTNVETISTSAFAVRYTIYQSMSELSEGKDCISVTQICDDFERKLALGPNNAKIFGCS